MLASRVGTDGLLGRRASRERDRRRRSAEQTCGPDQRDYAPSSSSEDPWAIWATPRETKGPKHSCAGRHGRSTISRWRSPTSRVGSARGRGTSRLSPVDVALDHPRGAKQARSASAVAIEPSNAEARDVVRECVALADLGEWFAHKTQKLDVLGIPATCEGEY